MTTETTDPWDALEEPSTRTPRSLETREKSTRIGEWKEKAILPEPVARDGWTFKWVRAEYGRGISDKQNYNISLRSGWEPVRAEDHPEIMDEWRLDQKSGLIETGGLILCKMPTEMVKQRTEHFRKLTEAGLTSAEEHYMRDTHELVQKVKNSKRSIVFGR